MMNSKVAAAPDIDFLVESALRARRRAYCPYSQYQVGAAVVTDEGVVFEGANVENVSYGLSICAERVAIHAAVASGARAITTVVVATADGGSPCGACRQVMQEFADDVRIILVAASGEYRETRLGLLLPMPFAKSQLGL